MIKSAMKSLIAARLGNRTDLDTRIDAELDAAQEQLEQFGDFTPWFLLTETAQFTTTAGEARLPVPTDMLQEWENGALFYQGTPLEKYDFDALEAEFYEETGAPEAYALVDDYFILFPTPDAAYTVRLKYYAKDTAPSVVATGGENRWMKYAPFWLLGHAGSAVARYIRDNAAAELFAADAMLGQQSTYKRHIDREEVNVSRQMGDL